MEEMYLEDLTNATEVVLDAKQKVRFTRRTVTSICTAQPVAGVPAAPPAGAVRIGNTIGAAFTNRRELGPVEARLMITVGALLLGLALLFRIFSASFGESYHCCLCVDRRSSLLQSFQTVSTEKTKHGITCALMNEYQQSVDEVLTALHTTRAGLTEEEAQARLKGYGTK